jgi:hypothetical protein
MKITKYDYSSDFLVEITEDIEINFDFEDETVDIESYDKDFKSISFEEFDKIIELYQKRRKTKLKRGIDV